VGVFLDLEWRTLAFHRAAERMQRARTGIPSPAEDQLSRHSGRDHLVVDQVRGEAADGKVPPALADNLVPGGKADEVGKSFDDHGVAVVDVRRHRLFHRDDFGADRLMTCHLSPAT
jgi:hypothetical protein